MKKVFILLLLLMFFIITVYAENGDITRTYTSGELVDVLLTDNSKRDFFVLYDASASDEYVWLIDNGHIKDTKEDYLNSLVYFHDVSQVSSGELMPRSYYGMSIYNKLITKTATWPVAKNIINMEDIINDLDTGYIEDIDLLTSLRLLSKTDIDNLSEQIIDVSTKLPDFLKATKNENDNSLEHFYWSSNMLNQGGDGPGPAYLAIGDTLESSISVVSYQYSSAGGYENTEKYLLRPVVKVHKKYINAELVSDNVVPETTELVNPPTNQINIPYFFLIIPCITFALFKKIEHKEF